MVFLGATSSKLARRFRVSFIEYWEGTHEEFKHKYNKLFPNEPVRIYGVGQSIPNRLKYDIESEFSEKIIAYNREREIEKLI
jgi:hypothetical protein